jgi:hypothetical protein
MKNYPNNAVGRTVFHDNAQLQYIELSPLYIKVTSHKRGEGNYGDAI